MVLFPSNALTFVRFAAMPWKYRSSKWCACWICRFFASFNRHHVISANKWFWPAFNKPWCLSSNCSKNLQYVNQGGFRSPNSETCQNPASTLRKTNPSTLNTSSDSRSKSSNSSNGQSLMSKAKSSATSVQVTEVPSTGILWGEHLQSEDLMKQIVGYLYTANGGWFQRWFKTSAALHVGMLFCQSNFQDVSRVNECVQQSCKLRTAWNGLQKKMWKLQHLAIHQFRT